MTLTPFLDAPAHIQLHAGAALLALTLGPFAIYSRRRGRLHRSLGSVWVAAMITVAVSSFWIGGFSVIGPFSPLHLLSCLALRSVGLALWHAGNRRFAEHAAVMRSLYWHGVIVAGLFNFLPGRMMNRMVFGEVPQLGLVVLGMGLGVILLPFLLGMGRRRAAA